MSKYGSVETSSSSSGPVRRVISNANFSVELFDGSGHFGMWQGEVLDAFFQQGLDIAIEKEKPEYMEEKEWGTINRLACSTIRSCLSREQKYGYKNETSASKMWKALEEKFLKKSSQNRLHMKKRLFRFDYQPGTSMNEHITVFNELVEDLLGMDESFKDEDLALMLLSSLPDEFEHLETTKKTKKESKYEAVEAMVARGHSKSQKPKWRGRSKSKSRLGKDECAFCHEKGHWKKDCPKLKKKGKAAPDACVAEHDAHDSDISLVASSTTFHSDDGSTRVLTDVRYVPNLKKNLISLGALESKGSVVTMRDGVLKVTYGALVMMKGIRKNNLYYYQGSTIIGAVAVASGGDDLDATQLWHMRLGHAGEKSLQILAKKGLLKGAKACKLNFCEHCVLGKQKRVKFGTTIHNTKGIVDYIHSDVWGPSKTINHYFVTFVDDFSRRVWVYPMKSKDEVLQIFLKWKNMIENQTGRKIKRLRTDNGGEYKSDPFFDVCHEYGIVRHFTVRHTPQQNGLAERMNRTLLEKVRCMLSNAGLGKAFWAEAVTYTGNLINCLPSSTIGGKTPLEVWSGKPATDYDSLHVFGSTAYYHVKESKLDPRAKKDLFMGITHGVKGFRLWCLDTKKIICSRDVTFDESALVKKVISEAVQTSSTPLQVEHTTKQVEFQQMMILEVDAVDSSTPIEESEDEDVQTQEPLETPETLAVTRPRREIRRPARFVDMVAYALPVVDDDIPITYQEAIQSLESDKWKSAMDEEMQSLQKNDTWKLAQLPKGKRAIGCKWVFVKKYGSHNKKDVRYKARLIAKGYAQKEGIDYNEVFSPVVKHSSIRILLALVAQLNLELAQLDVKTAFLHAISEAVLKDGSFIYLLLYVDDILIASKSQKEIDKLKAQLNQEFEMKDLGEAKKILGMEISRDRQRGKLCLTQKQYLRKVLQCFGMNENTKHVSIPLASHLKLSSQLSPKTNVERVYMAKVPYANAVGSLMYAMVCTRPDISQAVGVVSRYMHDPGEGHWQAVKWILRYLQQTVDVGLVFEQDEALGQCMVGYVDSDYAGDLDKRRSTTGYLFTLAKAPVSWKSTLQSTVALSTTEAEYMAVSEAVKEAIWLNGLMEDLGVVQSHISLYCDSQSAIHLAKNQVYHSRTKHIDVRYHFVREIFEEGKILLQKITTSENPADMMTKVATEVIEGMIIDNKRISNKMLNLNVNAISKMKNLRLLKVLCLSNCDELKYLPNELRLLDWMGYPLRFLPPRFQPDNLVALLLPYSRIEQLWRGNIQPLYKLNVLNLKGSENLIKTPDFTTAPNLEILILEGCTRIVDVHPSVGVLSRLKLLNLRSCRSLRNLPTKIGIESLETLILKDCRNLISLPRSIGGCKCLKSLDLSGCYKVENLPENLQQVELLEELDLSETAIAKPPSFIFQLKNLKVLSLNRLKGPSSKLGPNLTSLFQVFQRIESVPLMLHSLSGLRSLRELKLRNCNLHDGDIPSDISCLSSLEKLDLGGNSFISIPVIGSGHSRLQYLGLSNCRELKSFPIPGASRELFAAPSKVCNAPDWTQFSVLHCYRLVENINAITMLKFHLKRVPYLKKSSDGVLPGGEIPKWFSHQTVDSSIKIPLPNNIQNDSQWIGVVFCCIFVNDDASRNEELTCEAVIHHRNSRKEGSDGSVCRSRNPRRVTGCAWIFSEEYNEPIIKDHIYFCYFSHEKLYPFSLEDKCGESETENSSSDWSNKEFGELQLSVKSDDCHPSVKVKKCGIRILYEKDLEDNNEDSAVSGSIANGPLVKRKRNVYEETEAGSQPKRMEKIFNFMMGRPGKKH
ncbi:hypothetical protein F3Y22_tig00009009pilonHSYRG00067 [Hibiscus syriacus]|uniref:Uncharacterized protein n=1 Tax=Hibiscus syriacus TaxID=106335 RepID=A0A6A3C7M8_HIBSY|nr:hypothetical protein F3Y22_tig00009009pilonHSYRG00067 [Hibiscus syriacus]